MALTMEVSIDETLAFTWVEDLLHRALLEAGEPAKASEVARLVPFDEVDLRLARVVLASNPKRFAATDRKWTLWTRFMSPDRPVERSLDEILDSAGGPASPAALARELAAVYGRPVEIYENILTRLLVNSELYYVNADGTAGRAGWLLNTEMENEEDVLFDNYLKESEPQALAAAAAKMNPLDSASVLATLDKAGVPISSRLLQFLAWRADKARFSAGRFLYSLAATGQAVLLSSGVWVGPKLLARYRALLPEIADREVDEYGDNTPAALSVPLTISSEEADSLADVVLRSEGTTYAERLLQDVFEVAPSQATYGEDLNTVVKTLTTDERVTWLGTDRFMPTTRIPAYVHSVPENLHYPDVQFTDTEGNVVDLILEDDGFDGGLQREVLSMQAQDVLDEEHAFEPDANPPATQRLVLRFHHKEVGTIPLCQLSPGFFPHKPGLVQAEILLPTSHRTDVWINNNTRLVYGLLDWYHMLPVDSGAVFFIERKKPDSYVISYGEETEPSMFISRNRVNELLELGRRADAEEMPTFDILRTIMEHYRKGIDYITLLTEVNIARRTSRRLVASLLSGYHCFFQRGGAWVYDTKKLSQGFDRSKRKYLRK